MVKFELDGRPLEVAEGTTILQAAQAAGVDIPTFCFHPAFPPEGSCRLCLVAVEGSPKLELACSTVVREGLKVSVDAPAARAARQAALEFLLTDHPIDCPICDKAGECFLQDYSLAHGSNRGSYRESKEKRDKKLRIGETLLLDRERCVLCTRCVRFLIQVTRTRELGLFERGIRTEIGLYENEPVRNAYAGNLADICPVGAITDTTFRFKTRPWFLEPRPAVCPLCSRGCAVWADFHPGFVRRPGTARIFRFRARVNPSVNGPWICDEGRYGCPALDSEPADRLEGRAGGSESSWEDALRWAARMLKDLRAANRMDAAALVLSSWLTLEELFLARKVFVEGLGLSRIAFADPPAGPADELLRRADRSPNRKGAEALGFRFAPPDAEFLRPRTDFLWIFDPAPGGSSTLEAHSARLAEISAKILTAPKFGPLRKQADWALPSAPVFAKGGAFMNGDGVVQEFGPVHPPCGGARPEWEILAGLGRTLGLEPAFFDGLRDLAAVRRALRAAEPKIGERT